MAYQGSTAELTDKASLVCTVGQTGVLVQNLSSQPVTFGPPGVKFREGITLDPGERELIPAQDV